MSEYVPDGFGEPVGPEDAFAPGGDGDLDPGPIAARLVEAEPAFAHLKSGEASLLFLMRANERIKGGRRILGAIHLPNFQGEMGAMASWMLARMCDGLPDYIMVLDTGFWVQATPVQREALVFHELLHTEHATDKHGDLRFTPDGLPIWSLRGHDIEEFREVVRRYGPWQPDILAFVEAYNNRVAG